MPMANGEMQAMETDAEDLRNATGHNSKHQMAGESLAKACQRFKRLRFRPAGNGS